MLRKVMTQHARSCMQAAYAETNDPLLESIVETTFAIMKNPLSRFFRIENETGAFVGYFIASAGQVVNYFIRPHFQPPSEELQALFAEAQDPRYSSSIGLNNFITLNLM